VRRLEGLVTQQLYSEIINGLLATRVERTFIVGATAVNYRIDPLLVNKKNPKSIEYIESKLTEILNKNSAPNLGLLAGLLGIKVLYLGSPDSAPPLSQNEDEIAEEFAEKRLMCNDEELHDWVTANFLRFDQDTRDQIISEQFQKALFRKVSKTK
jgi:hypothetical protein